MAPAHEKWVMTPIRSYDRPGVILVAHGSARSGASAEPVLAMARELRRRGFPEVRTAFWKEETFLHQALDTTRSDVVLVLPVFLAEGHFSSRVVPRELDLRHGWNRVRGRFVNLLPALGTSTLLDELVVTRAREAAPAGAKLSDALLIVMGHGTERHPTSSGTVLETQRRLSERGEFARVLPAFSDQSPRVEKVLASATEPLVLIVPFLVAAGWHGGTTVPRDLGLDGERRGGERDVIYTNPVGTHPAMIDVVETMLLADAEHPVTHLPWGPIRLVQCEVPLRTRLASGDATSMMELSIRPDGGGYEVRHVLDAELDAAALAELPDRDALERMARTTAEGRHRPLRTAADLARGWRHRASTIDDLIEALIALYGPAIVHWYMGERGRLPAPSTSCANIPRQSVIHERLARVDAAVVKAGIQRTCDGLCLRSRLWPVDDPPPPPPPSPDRLIVPCPAPCPALLTTVLELAGGDEPEVDG
jgi:sirohydrochlorin cobaltochelatase